MAVDKEAVGLQRPHTICMAADKETVGLQRDHILSVWQWTRKPLDCRDHILSVWQQTRKPLDYRETTYYLYGSGQGSRWIAERPHTICMAADKETVGLQRDHILSVWQWTRKPLDYQETTIMSCAIIIIKLYYRLAVTHMRRQI